MPFSTRIRGVPLRGGEPGWSVENVFWWDTWALLEKHPHRELEGLAYTDYVLVLTPGEWRCTSGNQGWMDNYFCI